MADDIDQIVDNLKQSSSWIRVLFMIGFAILLYVIIAPVIFVLMIVQALFVLITGEYNANLRYLGEAMSQYVLQILLFISYNSELKPFPFSDFPASAAAESEAESGNDEESFTTAAAKPMKNKTASKKKPAARKSAGNKTSNTTDATQGDVEIE